jgi:beta-phosphoglucomutase
MSTPKAFLFDLNGTMINDMPYHIRAWHQMLNDLGAPYTLEQTKLECYGKNEEIFERIFPGRFAAVEKTNMGLNKEKKYQQEFRPHLKLIEGLGAFLKKTGEAGIKMGIGSAAIRYNIDFVLDGIGIRNYFDAIVSADDVVNSKPNAETFLKGAALLNIPAADCIVFEDSPKGVEAASKAGMKSVVLTTMHTKEEFNDNNILFFAADYTNVLFDQLVQKTVVI